MVVFNPLSKISWLNLYGSISGLLICSIDRFVEFLPKHNVLVAVVYSKSQSSVMLILQICFSSLASLEFTSPHKFGDWFVNSHKITCWDFDCDCLESIDQIAENWHLDNIGSSCHEYGTTLHLFSSLISSTRVLYFFSLTPWTYFVRFIP